MPETREILVSPGFGAGWSTWCYGKSQEVAEYRPIIDFIKQGGNPSELDLDHPLIEQMLVDLELETFYCGGADDLEVYTTTVPYRISEYDGNESITNTEKLWN